MYFNNDYMQSLNYYNQNPVNPINSINPIAANNMNNPLGNNMFMDNQTNGLFNNQYI